MQKELIKIPFLDIKRQYLNIREEVYEAIGKVMDKTAFSGGPFTEDFEKAFAEFCESPHAIGVNSGTAALHLALLAMGIGEGDEVIVPANTFVATALAVSHCNATPVFVDCDPDSWNISAEAIKEKISPATKAVIGVHLYGQPFDVDAVSNICKDADIMLLEDCAQAHGATYRGQKVGTFGELGCFSFYPGKNLGAFGEGGGITTANPDYDAHIRRLRNLGSEQKYYHSDIGYNMRMDGMQGAILSVKLKYIDAWNARRKAIAARYQKEIRNPAIRMQAQPAWSDSVYHLFVITTENRDGLMEYLRSTGVFPGVHYPLPCHLQEAYKHLGYKKGDFPKTEYLSDHCLSLPMFAEMTDAEVSHVIESLNNY